MAICELIKSMKNDKKALTAVTVLGIAGLCLIMLSSLFPDSEKKEAVKPMQSNHYTSEQYCNETEKKLAEFLSNIEGVGDVEVYLTVIGDEEYIYAKECKSNISGDKQEEEYQYVMIGSSSDKTALIETVKAPQISGAVIACSGCDSPAVSEKVYKAAATALCIPTSRIYVTKLS